MDDPDAPVGPPTPPSAPVPPPPSPIARMKTHKTMVRILVGVVVVVVIAAVKVGIAGIFNKQDHHAGEAERSVEAFLQAGTEAQAAAHLVGGNLKGVTFDPSCSQLKGLGEGSKFTVDSSSVEKDGSADVYAAIQGGPKMSFHVVQTAGSWLIDVVNCH